LGLAIASRIASAFRGSIDYVSPGTRGSRFTVRLPRVMESTM
jgi:signal transduction histidine kinase